MPIEAGAIKDQENKKSKITEEDKIKEEEKVLEFKKVKDEISIEIQAEHDLDNLKELVTKWVISKDTATDIAEWLDIDDEEIHKIFDKIDQIEELKDIDNYLPKELRITKDEYKKAVIDEVFRLQMITKVNSALVLLSSKISPDTAIWINLFSWFLTILDKKLVLIQEHTIDIRDNLEEINKNKSNTIAEKKSFIQKLIEFI